MDAYGFRMMKRRRFAKGKWIPYHYHQKHSHGRRQKRRMIQRFYNLLHIILRKIGLAPKVIPCPDCNKEDEIKEMNGKVKK